MNPPPDGQSWDPNVYGPPSADASSLGSAQPTSAGGDVLGDLSTEPAGPRRPFVPWIIGLVVLLVIGGGAVAVRAALGGGGDQPASALPASTIAYGRIDLDPSGSQKIAAVRLAQKFPGFDEATGITDPETDLRQRLWELIQGDAEPDLAAIDYATDIEPWLGSRAAIGYVPPADGAGGETGVVVALQVTDQEAATAALAQITAAGNGTGESAGVAFSGGYALIAVTQEIADAYAADAASASLADSDDFQRDMEALGEEGVASFWMSEDVNQLLAEAAEAVGDDPVVGGMDPASLIGQGNLAAALRFDESYVEVAFAVTGAELPAAQSEAGTDLMSGLPDSTLFAASTSMGSEYVDQAWSQLEQLGSQGGMRFNREIRRFEQQTGLSLPEDIATLLGEGFAFAVDSEGFDDIENLEDPADLRIGLLLDTDPAAATAIIDKLVAASGGGLELETIESDGLLAVSPNADYAAELTGGSLGATEAFRNAVPSAADADFAFFFSMDAFESSALFSEGTSDEALENLRVISAIGMSGSLDDGIGRASLRVVIGE